MRRLGASLPALVVVLWSGTAAAEAGAGWEVRLDQQAIVRWAPRYVLTAEEGPASSSDLFWRRVDQLPLYERLSLDARWRSGGLVAVDVHAAAWGALDLTLQDEGGLAAGDFAVAYGRATVGPVAFWIGRRFVPWGLPGGLHLDGGGVEARTSFGLVAEAVVGRPVTPVRDSLIGYRADFSGPATVAYGARVGYSHPGRVSALAGYLERWAEGMTDRVVTLDATYRPVEAIDLESSLVFEANDLAVEQASVRVLWDVVDFLTLEAAYAYLDPTRLLPKWSILSVFASAAYHEAVLGASFDFGSGWLVRGEGALRRFEVPGEQDESGFWGYRADLLVRYLPRSRRFAVRAIASRRADDQAGLTLVILGASLRVVPRVLLALEGTAAMEDDRERGRDSYLGRGSIEVDVGHDLTLGASFDAASTPIAAAELRGLLTLGWRARFGGGHR